MKIVITDSQTVTNGDLSLDVFRRFGELVCYPLSSAEELPARIQGADIVLTNKSVLDKRLLEQVQEKLKYIGLFATGYNNIDTEYCGLQGITVCNAGSYSTHAVAQHTFAFILHHFSQISQYANFVNTGNWKTSPTFSPFVFPTSEIQGKTIGLIGYGSIGKAVAQIAKAFGMKVLVYTRSPQTDPTVTFTTLEEVFVSSNVISIHCPLTSQSAKMFNRQTFAQMRDGAYFINTSRGGLVDEQALLEALSSGKLSGAAIDVLEQEPMAENCVLYQAPNLTITPHVAWAPLETRARLIQIAADNIQLWLEGRPSNVVSS